MITGQTAVFALLGSPVGHSLSPAMHNRWFADHGVDAVYVALEVGPDALLAALLAISRSFAIEKPRRFVASWANNAVANGSPSNSAAMAASKPRRCSITSLPCRTLGAVS